MATRCCCGRRRAGAACSRPCAPISTFSSASRARRRRSSGLTPWYDCAAAPRSARRKGRENEVEALEDKADLMASDVGQFPSVRFLMGTPSRKYSPWVGTSRQPRMFIIVDFPLPDCPMMATNSPRSIERLTPSSAWTSFSSPRRRFYRCRPAESDSWPASRRVEAAALLHAARHGAAEIAARAALELIRRCPFQILAGTAAADGAFCW